jgi:hypothetical protein
MTRCLDCGSPRTADQCPACGLTSAAAEVLLRRRLFRRTGWFLLGAVLFIPVSKLYPPLELDAILIFVGVMFFFTLALGFWIDLRARRRQEVELMKRIYFGFLPVPWLLTALLFLNGRFDTAPPARPVTTVVGKFSMPGFLRTNRLVVRSWRNPGEVERVPVDPDDYLRFQRGDQVIVQVQEGLVGITWVFAVYRKE